MLLMFLPYFDGKIMMLSISLASDKSPVRTNQNARIICLITYKRMLHLNLPLVCLWFWWYRLEECHCPYPGSSWATREISVILLVYRGAKNGEIWHSPRGPAQDLFENQTKKAENSKKTSFHGSSHRLPISWAEIKDFHDPPFSLYQI